MKSLIKKYIQDKKVLILGFGREGKSTYKFIRQNFQDVFPAIADQNINLNTEDVEPEGITQFFLGDDYLASIDEFDVIIKSPGVSWRDKNVSFEGKILLSQTNLFLEYFRNQIIGITGTKGKSTTASLIFHILSGAGRKAVLVGNIGQPPLDSYNEIDKETYIIFELSANQLEFVNHSPHIAVLLNLFPEHLDYFLTSENYYRAKLNIVHFQDAEDYFIIDPKNKDISLQIEKSPPSAKLIPINADFRTPIDRRGGAENEFEKIKTKLRGSHNLVNIFAAKRVCEIIGVSVGDIYSGIESFQPLQHRLEFVGNICGIHFYNDSISTIPESAIEAIKTIPNTNTLILGGFDRGLDYTMLMSFLVDSPIRNFIFMGNAGKRMMGIFETIKMPKQRSYFIHAFESLPGYLLKTEKGKACLLSPAASSYDQFRNFEERGHAYIKIAESLKTLCH